MGVAGFDGRIRESAPANWKWLGSSFALALCYWSAMAWISPRGLVAAAFPMITDAPLINSVLGLIPQIVALALTIPFHIRWGGIVGWVIVLFLAGSASGLALFLVMGASAAFGR